jgi:hypothetical protein
MISNAVLPSPHSHQDGWPVAVMSLHVQRYKKGTRSASIRLPFATGRDPASCRPNLANRSTSIYGKSGSVLRIDAFLTTLARADTLWAFYSHSAGSDARSHTFLRSFRLGRLTGQSDDKSPIIRWPSDAGLPAR